MRYTLTSALLLLLLAGSALADEHGTASNHPATSAAPAARANTGVGVVNRVDMQGGKVNLTHGSIESLGWPGMTMDFAVKDKALLAGLKAGEKVEFDVEKQGPGKFYIVRIVPSK